jgi:hypothetical protein
LKRRDTHYEMLGDANDYLRKHLSEAEKKKLSHVQAESLVGKILISSLNELWEKPKKRNLRKRPLTP